MDLQLRKIAAHHAKCYRSYKAYLSGTLPSEPIKMGAAQGVVYIGDYYTAVSDDVKAKLADIYTKLAAGEITITLQ